MRDKEAEHIKRLFRCMSLTRGDNLIAKKIPTKQQTTPHKTIKNCRWSHMLNKSSRSYSICVIFYTSNL